MAEAAQMERLRYAQATPVIKAAKVRLQQSHNGDRDCTLSPRPAIAEDECG